MKLPKNIVDQLCACIDPTCTKPHTIKELEEELGETVATEVSEETNPMCPVCKNNNSTYPYEYEGNKEMYCNECFNSFTESGELIPNDFDETVTPLSTKHVMKYDGNCYTCDTCEFETVWIKEANQHELVNDGTPLPTITKPIKHSMVLDGRMKTWYCTDCTFKTELLTEVIAHENNEDVKPETKTKVEMHYTKWKEKDKWYCLYCPATFTDYSVAMKHDNDAGKKANQTTTTYKHCTHKPQEVMKGDDWSIWAGRKFDCENSLNDFDVVLNLSGTRVSKRHDIPFKELKKWESKEKFKEICLDWPDRGVVSLPKQWWSDLLNLIKTNKFKMVVFCVGGHGRTGTAIASLLVTAFGWEPKEACQWIWDNYCDEAVETNGQISYVYNLVGQTYKPPVTTTQSNTTGQTTIINGWDND